MASQLSGALRCLCFEIGWSYAVFWRVIGSKNPIHLVWGDGYVVEERVEVLVKQGMTQQVHVVGEGIVGLAAATGNHQWILGEALNVSGSGSKGLADLNQHFLAGIQTITVIPVLLHGVLQLGSTQMVMENVTFVNHVQNLFAQLISMTGALLPDMAMKALSQNVQLCERIPLEASELLLGMPNLHLNSQFKSRHVGTQRLLHNPDAGLIQPAFSRDLSSIFQKQSLALTADLSSNSLSFPGQHLDLAMFSTESSISSRDIESESDDFGTIQLSPHQYTQSDFRKDFRKDTTRISNTNSSGIETVQLSNKRSHSKISQQIPVDPYSRQSCMNSSEPMVTEGNQKLYQACDVPHDESDVNEALLSNLQECNLSSSNICQNYETYSNEANTSQIKQNIEDNDDCKLPHVFTKQTTSGNDLYDILGPDYKIKSFGGNFDVFKIKNDPSVHELSQLDVSSISHSLDDGISGSGMFSLADTNQLLDAVVSNINSDVKQTSDDSSSCKASVTTICSSSLPVVYPIQKLIASSEQMQDKSFGLPVLLGKAEGSGPSSAKFACNLGNTIEDCSLTRLWVGNSQSMHSDNLSGSNSKRIDETGKMNRKRAKPGENPRPRPKDRQMIMDRVKELREIVPNGAKCSIDALLEKTINHMLYLQNVTKHGQCLKEIGEPKLIDKEGGLHLKENFQGGATWAFQVGTQSMTCPIIVENLNPPRQMLVEMLCEQRGFFLEIADLIRRLGLTILNGVMEAHKDKIWARFAVEANRDVSRMEIFISLVRLLESTFGSSTILQGIGDNINMPHNVYHHSCFAATGTSDRLQ